MSEADNEREPDIRGSRIKFLSLVGIAFVPIFVAYVVFFYFPAFMPSATTNQGELIQPAIPGKAVSSEFAQRETWTLLQLSDASPCDDQCQNMLYLSRQVVTGLGKDAGRISRFVVASGELDDAFNSLLESEHPDVTVLKADTSATVIEITGRTTSAVGSSDEQAVANPNPAQETIR